MAVTEGLLIRGSVVVAVDGLRSGPLTLENEIVLVMDPRDPFGWWPFFEPEAELEIEFSRLFARRCRRSPTFSVVSSVQERSALNIVTQS